MDTLVVYGLQLLITETNLQITVELLQVIEITSMVHGVILIMNGEDVIYQYVEVRYNMVFILRSLPQF